MDIDDLRSLWTVLCFLAFLGIVAWASSSRRKAAFEEAAHLVFDDEDDDAALRRSGSPRHR